MKSSMLGENLLSGQRPASSRVQFEIGEEDALVAKRVFVGEGLCGQGQTENERTGTDFGLSVIESFARVVVPDCIPVKVGAGVHQLEQVGFCDSFPRASDWIVTERSRYYPSQSAKYSLKEVFEKNPPPLR